MSPAKAVTMSSMAANNSKICSNLISAPKTLTLENMNSGVKLMEYAIRGRLFNRALEIEKELQQGSNKYPFNEVLKAHIGDSHAVGQAPIKFIRQVLALVTMPSLLDDPKFPSDAKSRARAILKSCRGGSIGSYSDSIGLELVRKHVVEYIEKRDGHPCNIDDIFLSAGASDRIKSMLKMMANEVNGKEPGIMVPVPQYPIYSATITEYKMKQIDYYLNEDKGWSVDIPELERSVEEARKTCYPRAIVIINPGNPTGHVLSKENIEDIIKFAHREQLLIMADEVYQHNVYGEGKTFLSFKKALKDMGKPYSDIQLASFMSCSKGYVGECGARGAYMELINVDPEVKYCLSKLMSSVTCTPVVGQVVLDALLKPPVPGEPSYEEFTLQKEGILQSFAMRGKIIVEIFNSIEGITCNPVDGSMYCFPKVSLPLKAVEKAKSLGKCPSELYCEDLIEKTGICVTPGAGFGQMPGTYHFRITILLPTDQLRSMLQQFKAFHESFLFKYK